MTHRAAWYAALAAMVYGPLVAAQTVAPRLTAAELAQHFSGQPGVPITEQGPKDVMRMQFADGYLAGVADSTQGSAWCDKGTVKTTEINSMVVAEIRKLPSQEQQRPASAVVVRFLASKFPCK